MTQYTPFFIGNYKVGLERDLDSYLIPDDAYPFLENAYLWRGRIYKKGGTSLLGRLGIRTDTLAIRTGGADTYNLTLAFPPIEPGSIIITDGVTTFTDNGIGGFVVTPVAGNGTVNVPTNYTTGAINITFNVGNAGASVTATYFTKVSGNSPVMGLRTFELPNTNLEGLIAFDLTSSYTFSVPANAFQQILFYKGTTNLVQWTGSNSDFFYSSNYQEAFFATNNIPGGNFYIITAITQAAAAQITIGANNFAIGDKVYINNVKGMVEINNLSATVTVPGNPITVNINSTGFTAYTNGGILWSPSLSKVAGGDGIRWYDGTGYVNFQPPFDSSATPRILLGALIVLPYKGRFVALNTFEGTTLGAGQRFSQRARYSQDGNIYYETAPSPIPNGITAVPSGQEWYETPGRGGFIDAPTAEEIISAEFIKDTLVVYFEASTWKLTFTGNTILPFIWEKINTEIGAESTFSVVPFDREILSVGQNGIYDCDSVNIERIDRIIPDEVFTFHNSNQGAKRVYGIRDFFSEVVYWTYANSSTGNAAPNIPIVFPNRNLIFNYLNRSFSIFKVSFTCFGYYQTFNDLTWAMATNPWNTYNRAWNSFVNQSGFPSIVAGNQQGFIFFLQDDSGEDFQGNDPSLVIQNITVGPPSVFTSVNHNLELNDFIEINNVHGAISLNAEVFQVSSIPTSDTFTLIDSTATPVSVAGYTYGGDITVVDNFNITTKNLNPFFAEGKSVRIGYADFLVDDTDDASITIDVFQNDDDIKPIETQTLSLVDLYDPGGNSKFWSRVYFQSYGAFVKLRFRYSDEVPPLGESSQIFDTDITDEPVVIHGMILWMTKAGRNVNTI